MLEHGNFKACLVDLDGTLADTAEANFRAYARALAECGVAVDRATFQREAVGRNWRQFLPSMLARVSGDATAAGVAQRKSQLYRETTAHTRFNDPLVMLLQQLRRSGAQLALVTTASAANVAVVLASRPDIAALFDLAITGDDVSHHKPDPEAYRLAARRLGFEPHECLVIEDSEIGLAAGRAFGAAVLRVSMDGLRA